ncbi:hypothetical protein [Streptomyces violascens]|uniref:hypothetical protein n=2 Tax=Streptomyces violascens TaxID=67381 RepID=UPI00367D5AEA
MSGRATTPDEIWEAAGLPDRRLAGLALDPAAPEDDEELAHAAAANPALPVATMRRLAGAPQRDEAPGPPGGGGVGF